MIITKIKLICIAAFLSIIPLVASAAPLDVRKITPPKLESTHLGQKILCYRPMRHGSPNMCK